MEFKARKHVKAAVAPAPETIQDRVSEAFNQARDAATGGSSRQRAGASGAAEAAGILTAVDEDPEGGEEAECPREFEYDTDAGEE